VSRPYRRHTGTADQVSAGRRPLATIDPGVMARVVGRPPERNADTGRRAEPEPVPAHRRAH